MTQSTQSIAATLPSNATRMTNHCRPGALVTISVPVYDEAGNIDRLVKALQDFAAAEPGYRFEFLFTDNGSKDETFDMLCRHAEKDERIRLLRLARNFGFQRSILTNFLEARGDAAIQLDADLQDPPAVAHEFLRKWEQGYFVAYGVRAKRKENWATTKLRELGYYVLSELSTFPVPRNAGDFRLIDRTIIEHLRNYRSNSPYLRGAIASVGLPQVGIPYARDSRIAGKSKFRPLTILRLGVDGICSTSTKPLELITILSAAMFSVALLGIITYLIIFMINPNLLGSGFASIILVSLLGIAFNGLCMGMIGEYVARIYNNTNPQPLSIIEYRVEHPRAPTSDRIAEETN